MTDRRITGKKPILDAVHETARDLHKLGFIDKRVMESYDALCKLMVQGEDDICAGRLSGQEEVFSRIEARLAERKKQAS